MSGGPTFDPGFSTVAMSAVFHPNRLVDQMLRVEAALATATAAAGLIPDAEAIEIAERCAQMSGFVDGQEILRLGWEVGTPVVALLDRVRGSLSPAAAGALHWGATSQDVIDTALQLQMVDAFAVLKAELSATAAALARHALEHRVTPCIGRTLLQQAEATTHGLRAARWLHSVSNAVVALDRCRRDATLQLGGPVGTLEAFGTHATRITADVAAALGLAVPLVPWHTDRTRVQAVCSQLAMIAGTVAKIAGDVVLLSSSEIGEVAVRAGGSSSVAGKANPIDAVRALATAHACRGTAATVLTAPPAELERAAGGWQVEWFAVPVTFMMAGAAVEALRRCAESLSADVERMRANLRDRPTDDAVGTAAAMTDVLLADHRRVARSSRVHEATARTGRTTTPAEARLAWRDHGPIDAVPIVLLHSLGASHAMWEPQVDALSVDHRVVTIDTLGHGLSDAPPGPYTLERLGRGVLSVLGELAIERAHVVGVSLGGQMALWLAIHAPERLCSLVSANTGAKIGTADLWLTRIDAVRTGGMPSISAAVLARWFAPTFPASHPDVYGDCLAWFEATEPEGYTACCEALAGADLRAEVGSITAPTLVIGGALDVATPPSDAQWLHAQIPGSRLVVIEDAAHLSNLDRPALFTSLLRDFVRGH